jgi:cation diffusion facilitator family transporter
VHHEHLDSFRESHGSSASVEASERRTWIVVGISAVMMVLELVVGFATGSLALFADGVHMATHVGALGISGVAYWLARRWATHEAFTFGTGKVYALSGFTSAIILFGTAVWMVVESVLRLWHPHPISFGEALPVAVIGLVVNLVCALVLGHHEHDHGHGHDHAHGHRHASSAAAHGHDHAEHDHAEHDHADHGHHDHADHVADKTTAEDHNLRAARLHVIADALTSVFAIVALVAGRYFGIALLDPLVGILGGVLVGRWAVGLCGSAAKQLLDVVPSLAATEVLRERLESIDDVAVADLHLWEFGPGQLGCIVKLVSAKPREASFYRDVVHECMKVQHLTVEVQRCHEHHEPASPVAEAAST